MPSNRDCSRAWLVHSFVCSYLKWFFVTPSLSLSCWFCHAFERKSDSEGCKAGRGATGFLLLIRLPFLGSEDGSLFGLAAEGLPSIGWWLSARGRRFHLLDQLMHGTVGKLTETEAGIQSPRRLFRLIQPIGLFFSS